MAQNDDGSTKVSMRIAGNSSSDVDLNDIVADNRESGAGKEEATAMPRRGNPLRQGSRVIASAKTI
jgi:hypothetical protein